MPRSSAAAGIGRRTALPRLVVLAVAAACGYGQSVPQTHFEVASVKPGGDLFATRPQRSPGRFRWTTEIDYLVGYAYFLDFSRIVGAFGPGVGPIYTVEAAFDPAATDDQVRLMLQSLLAERFKLRFHRVTKEVDGYALSIGKNGIKMKEANAAGDAAPPPKPGKDAPPAASADSFVSASIPGAGVVLITGRRASISRLAETLQRFLELPLWDRTGLSGIYDFEFRYAQNVGADIQEDAPSLATALRENLGLTLRKQKGPLESLVIDHIEPPSED